MFSHGNRNYSLIDNSMTQSAKFLRIQQILTEDPAIKSLLKTTAAVTGKYPGLGSTDFLSGGDLEALAEELNELKIAEMSEVLESMAAPKTIVAFPIRCTDQFTLFFVMVPREQKFDWHSHPKMGGISKCFHGELRISAIEAALLLPQGDDSYHHPRDKMRSQVIRACDKSTTSIVQHDSYNIHKIEALQFSAFFDLLVPDYPDNTCQFYQEGEATGQEMVLKEVEEGQEEVVGWDVYHQQLIDREKNRVRTFILK